MASGKRQARGEASGKASGKRQARDVHTRRDHTGRREAHQAEELASGKARGADHTLGFRQEAGKSETRSLRQEAQTTGRQGADQRHT